MLRKDEITEEGYYPDNLNPRDYSPVFADINFVSGDFLGVSTLQRRTIRI